MPERATAIWPEREVSRGRSSRAIDKGPNEKASWTLWFSDMHRIRILGNQGEALSPRVRPVMACVAMKHIRRVINKKAWGETICYRRFFRVKTWRQRGNVLEPIRVVQESIDYRLSKSMAQVAEQLRAYLPGWKSYFRLAQTPKVFKDLDLWLRRRLRAIQLKHWRTGTTICKSLRRLGATHELASLAAGVGGRWWHCILSEIHRVLSVSYFDKLGIPQLT